MIEKQTLSFRKVGGWTLEDGRYIYEGPEHFELIELVSGKVVCKAMEPMPGELTISSQHGTAWQRLSARIQLSRDNLVELRMRMFLLECKGGTDVLEKVREIP